MQTIKPAGTIETELSEGNIFGGSNKNTNKNA
jgi:hypothetical protein